MPLNEHRLANRRLWLEEHQRASQLETMCDLQDCAKRWPVARDMIELISGVQKIAEPQWKEIPTGVMVFTKVLCGMMKCENPDDVNAIERMAGPLEGFNKNLDWWLRRGTEFGQG